MEFNLGVTNLFTEANMYKRWNLVSPEVKDKTPINFNEARI